MNNILVTIKYLLLLIILASCNQNSSQVERDYIRNLEEKNKLLEKLLQEEKSKTKEGDNPRSSKSVNKNSNNYFTIGSTEDEVLEVMGDPTSYNTLGSIRKIFYYGLSMVSFKNGKVESYDNIGKNLKVRVK